MDVFVIGVALGLVVTATAVVGSWMAWRRTRPDAPLDREASHHQRASTPKLEVVTCIGAVPNSEGAFLIGTVTNLGDVDAVIVAIGFDIKIVISQSWVDDTFREDSYELDTETVRSFASPLKCSHAFPHQLSAGSRLECHAPIDGFVSWGRATVSGQDGVVAVNYRVTGRDHGDHAGRAVILRLRDWT